MKTREEKLNPFNPPTIPKRSQFNNSVTLAAWAEDLLRTMICDEMSTRGRLGPHPVPEDELESLSRSVVDGALNRAVNRVTFCRVMGMIDADAAVALSALFTLRNEHFAHFAGASSLSDKRVAQRLKEFVDVVVDPKPGGDGFSKPFKGRKYSKARCAFMDAFASLSYGILNAMTVMATRQGNEYQVQAIYFKRETKRFHQATKEAKKRTAEIERKIAIRKTELAKRQSQSSSDRASRSETT